MNYIFIVIGAIFFVFALKRFQGLKQDMKGQNFCGDEPLKIAKTVIKDNEEITFVSCGTNLDTLNNAQFKGYAGSLIRGGSTTQSYKYTDYTIVAKTAKHIYFIPAKITTSKESPVKVNPKMETKMYDLLKVNHTVTDEKPNGAWHSIDIKFDLEDEGNIHNVQFYDNHKEFRQA